MSSHRARLALSIVTTALSLIFGTVALIEPDFALGAAVGYICVVVTLHFLFSLLHFDRP